MVLMAAPVAATVADGGPAAERHPELVAEGSPPSASPTSAAAGVSGAAIYRHFA